MNPFLELLRQAARSQQNPTLPGPLNALPAPVKAATALLPGVGALAGPGGQIGQAVAGGVMDNPVGKTISGEGLLLLAHIVQAARAASGPNTPSTPMSVLADQVVAQGPSHPRRIQDMVEHSSNPILSMGAGAQQMVWDPMNFAGPAGELAQGAKLGGLARALQAADRAQNLPVESLALLKVPTGGRPREEWRSLRKYGNTEEAPATPLNPYFRISADDESAREVWRP